VGNQSKVGNRRALKVVQTVEMDGKQQNGSGRLLEIIEAGNAKVRRPELERIRETSRTYFPSAHIKLAVDFN